MSYQEKRNIVYLINSLLIFSGYGWYVLQLHQDGKLESTNWGTTILLLIPVHIGVSIITQILFAIINAVTTGEEEPAFADELDQSIELRATRNSYFTFIIGFLLAMGTVALEMELYIMFNALVFSFFVAEVVWISSQLYFYRRGV